MGLSDGSSSTIGDLNNTSDDYENGTATSSVSPDDSDDSSDSSESHDDEEPTGDGNGDRSQLLELRGLPNRVTC